MDTALQVRAVDDASAAFEMSPLSALLTSPLPAEVQAALVEHIRTRRWFRGKAQSIHSLEVLDWLPLTAAASELLIVLVRLHYTADASEVYVMPLACGAAQPGAPSLFELRSGGQLRAVYDPTGSAEFSQQLLHMLVRPETQGARGRILARPSAGLAARVQHALPPLAARVSAGEQSNTTLFFGQEFMLKLFRRLEGGDNPDVELTEFLWAKGYRHVPEPLGSVTYERDGSVATLGIVQRFVNGHGPAWEVTLEILQRAFEHALAQAPHSAFVLPSDDLLESSAQTAPEAVTAIIAEYAPFAKRLAQRTAELHIALASDAQAPAFKPEPFDADYQRSVVRAALARITHTFEMLACQRASLPDASARLGDEVLACRAALAHKLALLEAVPVHASRIRCHGDYHLGQVLYDGLDFTILDFEGEPAQPLEHRRMKRSALYDVCGMLRSFHYAATFALQGERFSARERGALANWSEAWYRWTCALFLRAYLSTVRAHDPHAVFLPEDPEALRALLRLHMIDKCSYELGYELNNRPAWVGVPLSGLLSLSKGR